MTKIDKLSGSKVRIEIEVTADQFAHGLDHAFEAIKGDVEVKGFRKGKVSRSVFEQHYGVESLYEEAIKKLGDAIAHTKDKKQKFLSNLEFIDKCFITSSPKIFKSYRFYNKLKFSLI